MRQFTVSCRLLSITAIATAFLAIPIAFLDHGRKGVYQRRLLRQLQDLDIPFSRPHQLTYLSAPAYTNVTSSFRSSRNATEIADTTAVILNWSRLDNVLLISSLLCSPYLHGTISRVIIWNNSPNLLTVEVRAV